MQVVRNVGYIKQQQRRGRRLTLLGFLALTAAFILVWQQRVVGFVLASYVAMGVGFILFNMGLQGLGKFSRRPRNDQQFDKELERLSDRHTLIHYAQVGQRHPEHLLVHNWGVLVITARELPGRIVVNGRRWRRGGNPLGRFLNYSGPQLGNPSLENEQDIAAVKEYLAERGLSPEIEGVIVFTNPAATVEGESDIDVVAIEEVADYVGNLGRGRPQLTGKDRQAIVEALSQGEELEEAGVRKQRRRPVKRRAA